MTKPLRVVGCFFFHNDDFLIIRRHPDKPEGGTWGVPAGKVDGEEDDREALRREVHEESGLEIHTDDVEYLGEWDFIVSGRFIRMVIYRHDLPYKPPIVLHDKEHTEYDWVTVEDCYARDDLIEGFHELLKRMGYVV